MAWPRWRIKTLMILTAIVAGLLAVGTRDTARAGLAIMFAPVVISAFLKPGQATTLFVVSFRAFFLTWVTAGPILLGFALMGFSSAQIVFVLMIVGSFWLPIGFGFGRIASLWIDFLFRTPRFWGLRDNVSSSARGGATWFGRDGGSRR